MKVTVNLISNIFIAGIISILPYLPMIRSALTQENASISLYLPLMVAPFITYIISAFGLEMAEQGYKKRQEKSYVSTFYFIMLISSIVVPYILGMFSSYINAGFFREISFIIFILLFIYTFYLYYKGSKISVIFLLPLLINKIYDFAR